MDEKRRVALVSSQRVWGGGEQVLVSLGFELEAMGHDVLWVALHGSALHSRLEERGSAYRLISGRHPSPSEVSDCDANSRSGRSRYSTPTTLMRSVGVEP